MEFIQYKMSKYTILDFQFSAQFLRQDYVIKS